LSPIECARHGGSKRLVAEPLGGAGGGTRLKVELGFGAFGGFDSTGYRGGRGKGGGRLGSGR
jgi:hypothetical protein